MYSFGHGTNGQLGRGSVGDCRSPKVVDALRHVRIVAAAAAYDHSVALAEDGTVFAWGDNGYSELGLGRSGSSEPLPQRVEALNWIKVCSVAALHGSSCAVAAAGELFTWGDGRDGRLGHGDTANQHTPRRVDALQGEWVAAVLAGFAHTVAVTRGGSVFAWGKKEGLGLQDNADGSEDVNGVVCIWSPCRYPQLACVRSP